jgi:hypothetical protein
VQADWRANYGNQDSGAHKSVVFRILLDGVEVQRWSVDAPYRAADTPWQSASFDYESAPLAASHTWILQAIPSLANSVTVGSAALRVTEWAE